VRLVPVVRTELAADVFAFVGEILESGATTWLIWRSPTVQVTLIGPQLRLGS